MAAEAAIKLGRVLYGQQQFWEVQVKTDPATLRPGYDPVNPSTFEGAASRVTRVDIIIATESGPTIQAYGAGGAEHEKAELTALVHQLLSLFPAATAIGMQVFYGENNLHAIATYQRGQFDYRLAAGP